MEDSKIEITYEHGGDMQALIKACIQAQGALDPIVKESVNGHFGNAYANIDNILKAVLPPLRAEGLWLTQHPGGNGALIASVTTALYHEGGGHIISTASCAIAKADPQKTIGGNTYLRRCAIQAILALPTVDDDGNGAAGADLRSVLEHCQKYRSTLTLSGLCEAANSFGFGELESLTRKELGQLVRRVKEELHG